MKEKKATAGRGSKNIRVDDDVWTLIEKNGTISDTPNRVLRRLLKIDRKVPEKVQITSA